MGAAFSEHEREIIKQQLKVQARECMTKYGIKKTTVDQLVEKVGISKGAFYKFYDSKELLFFEVLEEFHKEFYNLASNILKERTDLSDSERIEKAIWEAIMFIKDSAYNGLLESELPYLLRKLPEGVLENHYYSGSIAIRNILNQSDINLSVSPEYLYTAIHAVEVLLMNTDEINNPDFEDVLKLFIQSLCKKIVS